MTVALSIVLLPAHAMTFEETVAIARDEGPVAVLGEYDRLIARTRVGSALALNLPRLSISERQTYRYSNPEKYSFMRIRASQPRTTPAFPSSLSTDS